MNVGSLGADTTGRTDTLSKRWPGITDAVEHWARTTPSAVAVSSGAEELTYAELRARVDDTASRMVGAGVRPGNRVVLSGLNSPAWIVTFLATLRIGAVIVPLNSRLGVEQLPALIELIDPILVLVDESQSRAYDVAGVAATRRVIRLGAGGSSETVASLDPELSWRPPTMLEPMAPAVLSFTSGTTGDPKGAVVSSGALVDSAGAYIPWMHFADTAPLSTILVPLFHNTGYVDQMSFMFTIGGQVDLIPRYRTALAIDAMSTRPPSHLALVPSVFRMLMLSDAAATILVNVRSALVGGAPMPSAWSVEASARWPSLRLFHAFGLTEFTSVSHLLPADEIVEFGDSVGYPLSGVRHSIRDADGVEVEQGATGEVWVAGPTRMLEYWKRPDATAAVFEGPWLKTGDVGAVDDAGRLRIKGRLNQVINRGGEKILPIELEDRLSGIDSIAEAVVVGLPDPLMGERVVAAVRVREGFVFDVDRAVERLRGRIPDYAIPELFVTIAEMPYNPSGKIDRRLATTVIADLVDAASASAGSASDMDRHGTRDHRKGLR